MPTDKFDAIVIGAGLGGLTAAGYLAKAGKRVLVLEHHTVPGGYAHEFRRGRYRFEVSLHALDGAGPGGWIYPILSELGVLDRVRFHRLDPIYTAQFPQHEITAPADPLAYEAELIHHFPQEAQGIRNLIAAMLCVAEDLVRFQGDSTLGVRPPVEEMPGRYPHMLGAMGQSWGDFMGQYVQDPRLRGILSTLWAYYGLPPSLLNAVTFILPWVSYHVHGAYYPEGGSMAMSRAFERAIREKGGELRYRQMVNRIEIRDGRAVAVTTDTGLRAEAGVVISNANAPDTVLKLVGSRYLPEAYVRQVECAKLSLSNLVVYLGLERDLRAEGWNHHEFVVSRSYDPEASYAAMVSGKFEEADLVIACYNHADPTCAPEGGSVMAIVTLAPWDYANQWGTGGSLDRYGHNPQYLELKQGAADELIDRADQYLPGLRRSIKYMEVATPLTNLRYSLNPGGAIYGSEQTVENMYAGRLHATTPIPNLFLTGAWVIGGGQSAAMLSGRDTAHLALACLEGRRAESLLGVDEAPSPEEPAPVPVAVTSTVTGVVPAVTLSAIGSGRQMALDHLGVPAVLIFQTQETAAPATAVNQTIRQKYPDAAAVIVASIVDLHRVPRPLHRVAEITMKKAYQQATGALPAGWSPEAYVVILPDWNGKVTESFGLQNVDKSAGIVVLDRAGKIVGSSQDANLADAALAILARLGA